MVNHEKCKNTAPPRKVSHTITEEKTFKKNSHSKFFPIKQEALNYIAQNKEKLYLFSEDKYIESGSKKFYVTDRQTIYDLSSTKNFSLYENYEMTDKVKLFLDIDLKNPKDTNFDDLVNEAIETINEEILKYTSTVPEIIVLNASRVDKLSAHVIYTNIVFDNIQMMKFFMMNIESDLIKKKIIDINVYRVGCFRMLHNTKAGKKNILSFHKEINYTVKNDKQLFMDSLITYMPNTYITIKVKVPEIIKIVKEKHINNKEYIDNEQIIVKSVDELEKYVNLLDKERANDYYDWIQVGICLYNCNSSEECCDLWIKFSKSYCDYMNSNECRYKWGTFKKGKLGFPSLKFLARTDNPEEYNKEGHKLEEQAFKSEKFTSEYLLNPKEKISDKTSIFTQKLYEWMTSDTKTFSTKSTYNTGKTVAIKKIIEEMDPKRILFVTYRQSLTNDLYGVFKKYNVASYMNRDFGCDRLICQVESLPKLLNDLEDNLIPSYDLIIIDEIESVLGHFSSPTIKDKEKTFKLLDSIIFNSTKLLALDGDFGNRSYDYIKELGTSIIVENLIKKNKKNFIFTHNRKNYDKLIDDDLISGKNIAIVSMSSTKSSYYYEKYKDKYACMCHTSKTDDGLKESLKDVNTFWNKYRLVTYSPTIESGVNFDTEHFHKIYVIVSMQSTCPRSLMQMCSRIRKVAESTIHVYLNKLHYAENARFFTYDEVKEYVNEMRNKYLVPKIKINPNTNKKERVYVFDKYASLIVHNETEALNKGKYYFIPYLLKLIEAKGHTYELSADKHNSYQNKKIITTKEEILNASDIEDKNIEPYFKAQLTSSATKSDKLIIEKYMFKKTWNVAEVDRDFLDKFYGKTRSLINLRHLVGAVNAETVVGDIDKIKMTEQIKIIKKILCQLGYKSVEDTQKIEKKDFKEEILILIKNKIITDVNKFQNLFGISTKIPEEFTIKAFLGWVNSAFKEYGFEIMSCRKTIKVKIDGKWKTTGMSSYKIHFIDDINKYVRK